MHVLIVVTLTCWLCTLVASPRTPRIGSEAAELAYSRLLGRQQRLALLAFIATAALFLTVILGLPQRVDATFNAPPMSAMASQQRSDADIFRATVADTAPMFIALASGGCNDEMLCLSMYDPPRP